MSMEEATYYRKGPVSRNSELACSLKVSFMLHSRIFRASSVVALLNPRGLFMAMDHQIYIAALGMVGFRYDLSFAAVV